MQQSVLNIAKQRRNLVLGLIAAIIIVDATVFLTAGSDIEQYIGDISRIGTVASAVVMSLVIVSRQKFSGLFGRAYVSLAIGLALWLAAEVIWGYYELGLGVETPFPSIADVFWIASYAPFAYHLFGTARFFGKGVKKPIIAVVCAAAAVFLYFYVQAIVGVSELEGPDALVSLAISIAYPVFDVILLIPAVLMVTNAGKGQLTSIPWVFVGWILMAIADSLLGITAVTNFTGEVFHITMTYNATYLCFTAGLLWYNKLFIIDEKRLAK
ncbi:MAG TPA: hypothetical protein VHL10_09595 [Nitrososphaera sp.]|jgi:hypothetical protein|nr:hypothetical protein [Nitrososphaera sp.]